MEPAEIAEGMNAARKNAVRLASDAGMLLAAGSPATAAGIAILSIEEAGKNAILRQLALADDDTEAKSLWRDYRTHVTKNRAWILPQLVSGGARTLEDLRPIFDAGSDHAYLLNNLKQIAFYTDCLGDRHWSDPEDVIAADLARILVRTAELLSAGGPTSEQEMELWVKHMRSVNSRPFQWNKEALAHWFHECIESGLISEDVESVDAFLAR